MQPLKQQRNVTVAVLVTFLFGFIGLGIYLRSWRDAGISLAIALAFVPVMLYVPAGVALAQAAVMLYAGMRVTKSNAQLTASEDAGVLVAS
jgi:uncharacterized membrane protein YhaH (DUF805 family)